MNDNGSGIYNISFTIVSWIPWIFVLQNEHFMLNNRLKRLTQSWKCSENRSV